MLQALLNKFSLLTAVTIMLIRLASAQSISYKASYDFSAGATFSTNQSVATEETFPTDLYFSPDGMKVFIIGRDAGEINQYTLASAYDISGGLTYNGSHVISTEESTPYSLTFSNDGFTCYILGSATDRVYQYGLSVAFDITSTVTLQGSYYVGLGNPNSLAFNDDGTRFYVGTTSGHQIYQYNLSNAFDVTSGIITAAGSSDALYYSVYDFEFANDGYEIFVLNTTDGVQHFELAQPYDVSSGFTEIGEVYSVSLEESNSYGLALHPEGNRFFITGSFGDDINQFDLNAPAYAETIANNGSLTGAYNTFSLTGETFANPGTTLVFNTDYQISNLPAGLTPVIETSANGRSALLYFEGSATSHQNVNDVASLNFTFSNSAFAGGNAAAVSGAVSASTGISIDFRNNSTPIVAYGTLPAISGASYNETVFSVASEDISPEDIAFNPTGSKVFVIGSNSDAVFEYNLSTPFDLSAGVTYSGNSHSVSTEESIPTGVTFSRDGLTMFISGRGSNEINQYSLTAAFDLSSTIAHEGSLDISAHTTNLHGLALSPDGKTLLACGNDIYQFNLTNAFDITSGVSYETMFDQTTTLTGIEFGPDGTQLLYINSSRVFGIYDLSIPFSIEGDVTGASVFVVTSQDGGPRGISYSADKSKLFMVGTSNRNIYQYGITPKRFEESFNDNGTMQGTITLRVIDDQFNSAGATLSQGIDYTISGLPSGLSSELNVAENGVTAELILTGAAVNNDIADNVSNLQFTFNNSAFVNSDASQVINAQGANSYIPVAFKELNGQIYGSDAYQLAGLTFDNSPVSVATQTNTPYGLTFNDDGTKMFVLGGSEGTINQYALSIAYDVSTATVEGSPLDVSVDENQPTNLAFNNDGTRMYLIGRGKDKLHQYSLGTPFDINGTITHEGSVAFTDGIGVTFSSEGSRMFLTKGSVIYQYALNTPFDIRGGVSQVANTSTGASNSYSPTFSPNGKELFVVSSSNRRIYRYTLSEAFDISAGLTSNENFSISGQDTAPLSMDISGDGKTFYVSGGQGDDINVYHLPGISFSEVAANSGALEGTYTFSLIGDAFINSGGTLVAGTHFNITGLPEGLSAAMAVSADGSEAVVSLAGNAAEHQNADDITVNLTITFLDAAFVSGDASSISNTSVSLNTTFDYDDNPVITYTPVVFEEHYLNEGTVGGAMTIQIEHETFSNAGNVLTIGDDYSIAGLPSDLVPQLSVAPNGLSAVLSFSGAATDHQDVHDVADLIFTFENSAFTSTEAQYVFGAVAQSSGASIDFEDNNPSIAYGSRLNLAESRDFMFEAKFSVANEDAGSAFTFSSDGLTMFVASWNNKAIYQYTLTTPFDVSSGVSYSGHSFDVSNEENTPTDVDFSPDGTKMYVQGGSDNVNQYSLSSPFDLSAGATHSVTFDLGNDVQPSGITFSQNGRKMYMIGSSNDKIYQYSLEVPFDLNGGVTDDGTPYSVSSYNYSGIIISENGKNIFLVNTSYPGQTSISQYNLNVPYDITSGATPVGGQSLFEFTNHTADIFLTPDGAKLMILTNSQEVYQLGLKTDGFKEITINDGGVEGSLFLAIDDERFTNEGGSFTHGTEYTINNLPPGLMPAMEIAADGRSALLTLSGKATAHQHLNDVELEFTFANSAFEGGNAAAVAHATNASSGRWVDFRDNNPALQYGNVLDMDFATAAGSPLDVSNWGDYPSGIQFSNDGMKMFLSVYGLGSVYQYNLTNAYDITGGVSYVGAYNHSTEDAYAENIAFSTDGLRLFILGSDTYSIYQYQLTTPFDVTSGVTYSGLSFNHEAYDTSVYGFTFNSDGSKMYLQGTNDYEIFQFDLSTPFDLTGVSQAGSPMVTDNVSVTGMAFSADGRYLLMTNDNDYQLVRYQLFVPFDVSQGGVSKEVYPLGYWPAGIGIQADGSRVFVLNGDNYSIQQFDIDLGGFKETVANDGTVSGSVGVDIIDDTFTNAGASLTHGVDFNINNLPSGLSVTLDVAADGYSATVTLSGTSANHGDINDIESLQFHFQNSAFSNYPASEVANASNHNSNLGIDYRAYTENDITSFTFAEINGPELIFTESHTITAEAATGTDISALTPTVMVSPEATLSPDTGVAQDFTSTVTYTVTAEDGTPQEWQVTITEKPAAPTDILLSNDKIDENSMAGTLVGTLSTVDASFADAHSYTFVAGTNDNESFSIMNGNELVTTEPLDYENSAVWLVDLMTDDGNGGTFTKQIEIHLNDVNEAPTALQLSGNTVDESSPTGTVVGMFTTTDEDGEETHTYSLKSGNTDNDSFDIDGNNLITAEVLDYETKNVYNLEVIVTDKGGLIYEEAFVIQINNLPPQITSITLSNDKLAENSSIGSVVGDFATFGEDLSGSFSYTLVTGAGDTDNASFDTSGDQLITKSDFDFETKSSYSIRVMSDDGNLTEEQVFTISITDQPEAPTDIQLSASEVAENNTTGEVVGLFTATDEDTGESHTYTLVAGEGDSGNAAFAINQDQLLTAAVYDFETQASYSIRVQAHDGNGGTYQKVLTITILNQNESILIANPIADQSLDEGFQTHQIDLSTVFADQDNDPLTYEVSSSNTDAVTVTHTGATLTITEVGLGTATITVTADDGSGVTTSDEFAVVVNDVNESPVVSQPIADILDLIEGFVQTQVSYVDVFTDGDGDELTIEVSSSEPAVVTVSKNENNQILIDEAGMGTSVITVTATDGRGGEVSDQFTVTVSKAPSSANDIVSFSVADQIGESLIDINNHTVELTVGSSADITSLSPQISVSDLASISPESGIAQDFSAAVVYTVTAENGDTQNWTVTVEQKKAQTISIHPIGEKVYGDDPFQLVADATSQLNVSLELVSGGNAVSLQGSTITIVGAGDFTVRAYQAGNAEYEEASVEQTLTIQKAVLTATADDKSREYGTANPELTIQYAGFVNGDELTDLQEVPVATTVATATSDVGNYAIEVSVGNNANYTITPVSGTLTIVQATAEISITDLEQDADGSAKKPTVTTSPEGLNFTITFDGESEAPTEAGTYAVVVSIEDTNYKGEQTANFTINGIATGIEDLAWEYSLYPNPAQNWVKIETPENEALQVAVYDLNGQLVLTKDFKTHNNNLDISGLKNGFYLISLQTKQYSTTTRLLIKR